MVQFILAPAVVQILAFERATLFSTPVMGVLTQCLDYLRLSGFSFPFVPDKLKGQDMRIIAVEPEACPTITKGPFAYDYGDTAKTAPIAKMFTLGHDFIPAGIHAGGLRYHGMAPQVSLLANENVI